MGKESGISWTHSTFNPWWGCAKVSEACENCYAETWSARMAKPGSPSFWGATAPRRFFGTKHWAEPLAWDRKAAKTGEPWRVFCGSMCDVFEDRPELCAERLKLWSLTGVTPSLTWIFLTKRPENIIRMVPNPWGRDGFPCNIWLGTTAESQEQWDKRIPELLKLRHKVSKIFVSVEPMLGPIDIGPLVRTYETTGVWYGGLPEMVGGPPAIDWVICGGESIDPRAGKLARPMHPTWARGLRDQCREEGVAFFMKQWGDAIPVSQQFSPGELGGHINIAGATLEYPWKQQLIDDEGIYRVGKKRAGCLLDGQLIQEIPA